MFLINSETGEVGKCTATKRECPVGGAHFEDEKEARTEFERQMESNVLVTHKALYKPRNKVLIDKNTTASHKSNTEISQLSEKRAISEENKTNKELRGRQTATSKIAEIRERIKNEPVGENTKRESLYKNEKLLVSQYKHQILTPEEKVNELELNHSIAKYELDFYTQEKKKLERSNPFISKNNRILRKNDLDYFQVRIQNAKHIMEDSETDLTKLKKKS